MKFAVIKTNGRQYKVQEGDELEIDKIDTKKGANITFDQVLLLVTGKKVMIGQPLVSGATVEGKILSHYKGKKVRVATYKAKSRYRRVKGFRARLTRVKIEKILQTK